MRSRTLRTFVFSMIVALAPLSAGAASAPEFQVRGLLDVAVAPKGAAFASNVLIRGDSPFDAYGARVFGEGKVNNALEVFLQVVLRDASSLYVDGAYATYTPMQNHDLHVQAGKIPWAIGTYAPRTYSNKNPLVGAPLMYQYHTTLIWHDLVPSADALLATSGKGQYSGVDYEGYSVGFGMALVDDSYWDVGVTVLGSARPVEFAAGVVAGTPGWGTTGQEENSGKSVLGRLGVTPLAGVRLGVSGSYGPYLLDDVNPELPAGKDVGDYRQQLAMADLELVHGHAELRSEAAYNVWETPTVGDLNVTSGYVELKYSFPFGAFAAGRYDVMRFGRIADSLGNLHPWDSNLNRIETGVGYRFSRDALAKVVFQRTHYEINPDPNEKQNRDMVAGQFTVGF